MMQDFNLYIHQDDVVEDDDDAFRCASLACSNYTDGVKSHCQTCIEDAIGDAKYHARKDGE